MNSWYGDVEPAVAIGSTKSQLTIGSSTYFLDGIPQTVITGAGTKAFSAVHTALAANQKCRILVSVDSSQAIVTTQGPIVADSVTDANTVLPAVPADTCPLGDVLIETTAAETFVFQTTELDANTTNASYRDFRWPDSGPDAISDAGA